MDDSQEFVELVVSQVDAARFWTATGPCDQRIEGRLSRNGEPLVK